MHGPVRRSIILAAFWRQGSARNYSATSTLLKHMDKDTSSAKAQRGGGKSGRGGGQASTKQRGRPSDNPEVRLSKTVSWILRHGAEQEGLKLREDGYVRVDDLLSRPKLKGMTFEDLQDMVQKDAKTRFSLIEEPDPSADSQKLHWWIRANQGHSLKTVKLDLQPITSISDIPTGVAVHGTNAGAWEIIKNQGLSKMTRNHIHLAQGVPGSGVISGMRNSANVLIYVDVQKALDAGIKFSLSSNGVVLTEGDESGFLRPQFFQRVTDKKGKELDWRAPTGPASEGVNMHKDKAVVVQTGESTLAVNSSKDASTSSSHGKEEEQPFVSDIERKAENLTI